MSRDKILTSSRRMNKALFVKNNTLGFVHPDKTRGISPKVKSLSEYIHLYDKGNIKNKLGL